MVWKDVGNCLRKANLKGDRKVKYDCISIRPYSSSWIVTFSSLPHDREEQKEYKPHVGLGIFNYPSDWKQEKAFLILRNAMIKSLKQQIEEAEREISSLEKLTWKPVGVSYE